MTFRSTSAPLVALALCLAAAPVARTQPREFAHIRELGGALVEYNDGATQAVAAYYHSRRHHDTTWLLIEVGLMSRRAFVVGRDQVQLTTPSGQVLPLASQRDWGDDAPRARALMQQAQPSRHQLRSSFREVNGTEALRFFTHPATGGTVLDSSQAGPEQVLLGDLLFKSPTGAWDRGTYALVIHRPDGAVRLPIELR